MKVEHIAQICHEANRAYCLTVGDSSQPSWSELPEEIKQSAIDGVMYHITNENSTPVGSHQNWMCFKKEQGWVYGEVKDFEKKTHPCMVPYNELPVEQQRKDFLFHGIVNSLRSFVIL